MKKQIRISILSLLITLFATQLFAQNENVWLGGKPGRKADWNMAANWSKHRVPNEFDHVVILNTATTTQTYPFISGEVTVESLYIESGAEVVLRDHAMLIVLRWRGTDEGATLRAEPDPHALQIDVNKDGEAVVYQGARKR